MMRRSLKISDEVVGYVRYKIFSDQWNEGFKLPKEQLMLDSFGIGKVTLRESIRLLEHDGLLVTKRGAKGGVFVRRPSPVELSESISIMLAINKVTVREALELRLLIEPRAAAMAAANGDDHLISQLQKEANRAELKHIHSVHFPIARMSGNRALYILLSAFEKAMSEGMREGVLTGDEVEASHLAHVKVANRIATRDVSGAERAMKVHLEAYYAYADRQGILDSPVIPPESWKVSASYESIDFDA